MNEIIFEVREDEVDGGYTASALGYGIHTQGETLDELRAMVKEAVACYFDETMEVPKIIHVASHVSKSRYGAPSHKKNVLISSQLFI